METFHSAGAEGGRHAVHVFSRDPADRDALVTPLSHLGFDLTAFPADAACLDGTGDDGTACAILVVDADDAESVALMDRFLRESRGRSVIVLAENGGLRLAVDAMRRGAFDVIEKPFAGDHVARRVVAATRGRGLHARVARETEDTAAECVDARLTPRERQVLHEVIEGKPTKMIARDLGISPRTVEVYRARVRVKLRARNVAHLVRLCLDGGIPAR